MQALAWRTMRVKGVDVALSEAAKQQLDEMAVTMPGPTHHSPEDYRKPVRIFVALYRAGDMESLHPDVIRAWASERGWSESDAEIWERWPRRSEPPWAN